MSGDKPKKKRPTTFDFRTYLCVFTYRYGSDEMRNIWSLDHRAHIQRQIWVAVADAMHEQGLVSDAELADLKAHEGDIDIAAIMEREDEIGHDIMAAISLFREVAKVGGGKIHLGMTSEDNSSNLDIRVLREGMLRLMGLLEALIDLFADRAEQYADTVSCGYTHLQSGTATTIGYRLSLYLQDLLLCRQQLLHALDVAKPKGLRGATGTRASFLELTHSPDAAEQLEIDTLAELGLPEAYTVTGQTYPRIVDHIVLQALSTLALALHKFALDMRLLQSTPFNEMAEPFGAKEVGSTAMPWKRNPKHAEKLCALARIAPALGNVAWMNGALVGLDRTLDESASRRIILPIVFLLMDETLLTACKIVRGLIVKQRVIERNMLTYGIFGGLETMLMHLVKDHGQDRQVMHELLREASMEAWEEVEELGTNPLAHILVRRLPVCLPLDDVQTILLRGATAVGDAPARARQMVKIARERDRPSHN